ncbi:N-terminal Xaa-Pro-Lys N-methyltransferase 1-B-like [Haliotis rubra]|uniref:N-terminal Xaa-Pro-Lys N-methyltransferase 1-B-like n=1 Tax=Haliotis rubra TaxID=36100 RepID=UPI001EE5DF89|nr:N-terminal Xaa-Pro-Lys N-methyltransferase 1-B-like [Haliotis rubra]XP_046558287.1 N-terminal Xaa-Pro-Lys N-methyltransferase 1-B-like [Haliotis rubra]
MADTTTHVCGKSTKTDAKFYSDAKEYWDGLQPTIDAMLGGYAKISPTDIDGSKAFLRPYLKISGGKTNSNRALDCGAGIGRITKRLLLPMFTSVDLVELSQKFVDAAPKFIGEESKRVGKFICSGLQDFTPDIGHYDVIWCQWVLGHLRDDHLVSFFRSCKQGLSENGIMVVKENVTSTRNSDFDELDSSFTRPLDVLVQLIQNSGLVILKQQKQKGFPKGLYDVYMFALK